MKARHTGRLTGHRQGLSLVLEGVWRATPNAACKRACPLPTVGTVQKDLARGWLERTTCVQNIEGVVKNVTIVYAHTTMPHCPPSPAPSQRCECTPRRVCVSPTMIVLRKPGAVSGCCHVFEASQRHAMGNWSLDSERQQAAGIRGDQYCQAAKLKVERAHRKRPQSVLHAGSKIWRPGSG